MAQCSAWCSSAYRTGCRGVTSFERYIAERDLVHEVGGYAVLTALYEVCVSSITRPALIPVGRCITLR
jgi:hypothetical protein